MEEFAKILFINPYDHETGRKFILNKAMIPSFYLSIVYVIVIFSLKFIMKNRKPFELSRSLELWNAWLAIFSVIGSVISSRALYTVIVNEGVVASYTRIGSFFTGASGYMSWLFCLSKILELGDTIFLVLRKKPLIFLHWYHHVLTLNYGMISLGEGAAYNTWIIWLNFSVHAIMYSYYLLRSLGVRVPAAIAKNITNMQIAQFLITLVILCHCGIIMLSGGRVDTTIHTYFICLLMEISYVILFANFFYQSYVKGGGKKFISEKKQEKSS
ncbi:hypothetical protein AB6A40_000420 [Gnathostoma spinigerum]|uniref:Elongation of very long chain fatty acids protein n=1 Tax=Gnathostoma spinigerum TaxID=75299 RepID=A0ABD6E433_9BILA